MTSHPNPTVSFIVPCYNYAHYLPECMGSLLAQSYRDFEILIMDDCSPDNTPEVAASFDDPRVRHIRHPVNLGAVANINAGIKEAKGRYLWIISPDDSLIRSDAVERYVAMMEANPRAGFICSTVLKVQSEQAASPLRWTDHGPKDTVFPSREFYRRLVRNNRVSAPSVMVRAEAYQTVGLWDASVRCCPDWFMWCRLALRYEVAYQAEPIAHYRIHEQSEWQTGLRDQPLRVARDELKTRWLLLGIAQREHREAAARDTVRAIVTASCRFLTSTISQGDGGSIRAEELEEALDQYCTDQRLQRRIRRAVYTGAGNRSCLRGNIAAAREFYRRALETDPRHPYPALMAALLASGISPVAARLLSVLGVGGMGGKRLERLARRVRQPRRFE